MTKLQQAISDLGLTMGAEFIPLSKSREPGIASLNWRLTISRGSQALVTNYTQGMAHVPEFGTQKVSPNWRAPYSRLVCERGRYIPNGRDWYAMFEGMTHGGSKKPVPPPDIVDVICCLVQDASVIDYPSFESWAPEYGYDPDSRKGEAVYRECLRLALTLRNMIGDAALTELAELYQDF